MENENSEKWMEEVLGSMRGSKEVMPSRDLFAAIESRIDQPEGRILSFSQKMLSMAAAILLICLNVFAMNAYGIFEDDNTVVVSSEPRLGSELFSDFKIYE